MPYDVTQDFYNTEFAGEPVPETDFPALCARAAEIVEDMTMYRLNEDTFLTFPAIVQTRIKKAICAQIEYLDANGGSEVDTGTELASAALGKFSYSAGAAAGTGSASGSSSYAPRAMRILAPTGMLYRGGGRV